MDIKRKFADAPFFCALAALASLGALAAAYTGQYAFGLAPCTLCLYQRVPYALVIVLGLAGFLLARRSHMKKSALVLFLCALAFLAGAVIAFYHVGVEQRWWVSFLEGCKINFSSSGDLLAEIESAKAVRCDEIAWSDPVLHLSMAGWNVIVSFALALACFMSSLMTARKANGFV